MLNSYIKMWRKKSKGATYFFILLEDLKNTMSSSFNKERVNIQDHQNSETKPITKLCILSKRYTNIRDAPYSKVSVTLCEWAEDTWELTLNY